MKMEERWSGGVGVDSITFNNGAEKILYRWAW